MTGHHISELIEQKVISFVIKIRKNFYRQSKNCNAFGKSAR